MFSYHHFAHSISIHISTPQDFLSRRTTLLWLPPHSQILYISFIVSIWMETLTLKKKQIFDSISSDCIFKCLHMQELKYLPKYLYLDTRHSQLHSHNIHTSYMHDWNPHIRLHNLCQYDFIMVFYHLFYIKWINIYYCGLIWTLHLLGPHVLKNHSFQSSSWKRLKSSPPLQTSLQYFPSKKWYPSTK